MDLQRPSNDPAIQFARLWAKAVELEQSGQYTEAIDHLEQALTLKNEAALNPEGLSEFYDKIIHLHTHHGNPQRARTLQGTYNLRLAAERLDNGAPSAADRRFLDGLLGHIED